MSEDFDLKEHKLKMEKTLNAFLKDLSALRTGRANITMLDIVKVDVYGQKMPIDQLGTLSVPEPRLITIQVWDNSIVSNVEKAIMDSNLGITPQTEGTIINKTNTVFK